MWLRVAEAREVHLNSSRRDGLRFRSQRVFLGAAGSESGEQPRPEGDRTDQPPHTPSSYGLSTRGVSASLGRNAQLNKPLNRIFEAGHHPASLPRAALRARQLLGSMLSGFRSDVLPVEKDPKTRLSLLKNRSNLHSHLCTPASQDDSLLVLCSLASICALRLVVQACKLSRQADAGICAGAKMEPASNPRTCRAYGTLGSGHSRNLQRSQTPEPEPRSREVSGWSSTGVSVRAHVRCMKMERLGKRLARGSWDKAV